jgi:hypothetical protein
MFKRKSGSKPEKKAKPTKKAAAPAKRAPLVVQKPETDIYTVMLIVSCLSVLVGCLLLYLELSRYGSYPWWK